MDMRNLHRAVLSRWLPLTPRVLDGVVDFFPSPAAAQRSRIDRLGKKREKNENFDIYNNNKKRTEIHPK
jgi:hypothetical protein